MVKLILEICDKPEFYCIYVYNINLNLVTNNVLISLLVCNKLIRISPYEVIGKNNRCVEETATLAELGYKNGDIIRILYRIYN